MLPSAHSPTIAFADYDKLVALLGTAFDGTAQRGSTLPIYYDEFGVESQIPPAKASLYTGQEPAAVTTPAPTRSTVSCIVPGHDRRGTELINDDVVVDDPPFAFELHGTCGFTREFDYSG